MYSRFTIRFGATALLIGAGLLTPALVRAQDPTRPPPTLPTTPVPKTGSAAGSIDPSLGSACTVKIGDALHAGAMEITVDASLTSAIGDSISASFPMASKITVVKVAPAAAGNGVQLTLNTSAASPGDYTVSLKGTKGECRGKVKVESHQ